MLQPIILAGGSGTRLWPLSRELYPKQFLSLIGEKSLLQETICRLDAIGPDVASPVIVCNEEHRFLAAEDMRQIDVKSSRIILEPEGRNTAPALTLAAYYLVDVCQQNGSSDPVMLVMPADHAIMDVPTFQEVVKQGVALAEKGYLVTFGIVPSSPKTGFGYIRKGERIEESRNGKQSGAPFRIAAFVEKPDRATAEQMLETEEYLWNSGIFMMRASVWLEQLEYHRSDIAEACRDACKRATTDGDFFRPDPELFAACPSDSIDYAVMEKMGVNGTSHHGAESIVLPLDVGWSDLGEWSTLWEIGDKDADGNVVQGDVYSHFTKNSLIIGQHRIVAAVGLEDVIIVDTPDAVLVASKEHVQDVKALVAQLKSEGRPEQENHNKVHRPWGSYKSVDRGPGFQVKRLTVNPGASLSLQMHHHRAEHWVVVKGTARVTKGEEQFLLTENESAYVPVGVKHRLENAGTTMLEIIEVQTGSYLEEDDIVRFEDKYNRQSAGR